MVRAQVEAAGSRLEAELGRVLSACMGAWEAASSLAALRPVTVYDPVNVAVWLKAIAKSPVRSLLVCGLKLTMLGASEYLGECQMRDGRRMAAAITCAHLLSLIN